ncbi:hypothetical protein OHA25_04895 [Nonomuraea sp. NBC_00507]|uniref:hypothetical protein n=1 Tax=Nonomuraea sp. NBC_00507 TaxID=2976002 RepID=UPI002E1717C7
MSTTPSINGTTSTEQNDKCERKHGMAYLHDAQLHHAATLFDTAVFEVNRLANAIQREASTCLYDRGEIDEKAIHDQLTEAQNLLLAALHFSTELHQLTCPNQQQNDTPEESYTGFTMPDDNIPF